MYKILEENVTKLEFDLYFVTFSSKILYIYSDRKSVV